MIGLKGTFSGMFLKFMVWEDSYWKELRHFVEASACANVHGELSDNSATGMGVRQRHVMSPWLFIIFMDGCIREMKAKSGKCKHKIEGKWSGLVYGSTSVCV